MKKTRERHNSTIGLFPLILIASIYALEQVSTVSSTERITISTMTWILHLPRSISAPVQTGDGIPGLCNRDWQYFIFHWGSDTMDLFCKLGNIRLLRSRIAKLAQSQREIYKTWGLSMKHNEPFVYKMMCRKLRNTERVIHQFGFLRKSFHHVWFHSINAECLWKRMPNHPSILFWTYKSLYGA